MSLAAPEEMPAAFSAAWMARDAKALAALFAGDADFVNVVGIWWEDRAAIEEAHAYGLSTFFRDSRLSVGRVKVRMLGEAAAVVHARTILSGQMSVDGAIAGTRRTILVFVMERRAAGWVCVAAQNTDIVPGSETYERNGDRLVPGDYR